MLTTAEGIAALSQALCRVDSHQCGGGGRIDLLSDRCFQGLHCAAYSAIAPEANAIQDGLLLVQHLLNGARPASAGDSRRPKPDT